MRPPEEATQDLLRQWLAKAVEFPKTHDLGRLLDLVATANAPLAASLRGATALNPLGATMRYPSDLPELTAEDARTAVGLADAVREAVHALLGDRTGRR